MTVLGRQVQPLQKARMQKKRSKEKNKRDEIPSSAALAGSGKEGSESSAVRPCSARLEVGRSRLKKEPNSRRNGIHLWVLTRLPPRFITCYE